MGFETKLVEKGCIKLKLSYNGRPDCGNEFFTTAIWNIGWHCAEIYTQDYLFSECNIAEELAKKTSCVLYSNYGLSIGLNAWTNCIILIF